MWTKWCSCIRYWCCGDGEVQLSVAGTRQFDLMSPPLVPVIAVPLVGLGGLGCFRSLVVHRLQQFCLVVSACLPACYERNHPSFILQGNQSLLLLPAATPAWSPCGCGCGSCRLWPYTVASMATGLVLMSIGPDSCACPGSICACLR